MDESGTRYTYMHIMACAFALLMTMVAAAALIPMHEYYVLCHYDDFDNGLLSTFSFQLEGKFSSEKFTDVWNGEGIHPREPPYPFFFVIMLQ